MVSGALTGLILAGGQGRRMQGADSAPMHASAMDQFDPQANGLGVEKGLLMLDGLPLVAHAQRFLAPHTQHILISANRHQKAYAQYGEVVSDDSALEENSGPLAGIASVLSCCATDWLVVLPVDVPRPPADLVKRLAGAVGEDGPRIAYARSAERAHPLCMVVHRSLKPSLYQFLQMGERKVRMWQARYGAVPVLFDVSDDAAFFNINTPADLLRASRNPL